MQIVRMMGEELESGRSSQIIEDMITGEDPDAKAKATKINDDKIGDAIRERHIKKLGGVLNKNVWTIIVE